MAGRVQVGRGAGRIRRWRIAVFAIVLGAAGALDAMTAATPAQASSSTFGGTVSAAAVNTRWHFHFVTVPAAGRLEVGLEWANPSAQLTLSLFRKNADGTTTWIAGSAGHRPEHVAVAVGAGTFRIGVKAVSGASSYTVSASYPDAVAPPFLTLLFSRSELTVADNCVPDDTGVARLDMVVAPELAARGLSATGSVETGATQPLTPACLHYKKSLAASWADLAWLRDTYGWSFVSHSRSYAQNLAALTPQGQWNETCGSLNDLRNHGHTRADGLYLWPNNRWDLGVETNVVDRCFAFGRRYGSGVTDRASGTAAPYWQSTVGLSGGRCADVTLPCSALATPTAYRSPQVIAGRIASLLSDQWMTLQAYVLVTGSRDGLWDCTSPDWTAHWSTDAERYCWSDYLWVLDHIPAAVKVTDPKSVAHAWGRPGF
jgi:hypothetical protein